LEKGDEGGFCEIIIIEKSPLTPVRKSFLYNGAGPLCQRGVIILIRNFAVCRNEMIL
jgi:hypothetical protein